GVEILVDPAAPLEVVVTDPKGAPLAAAYVRLEPRFRPLHPNPEYSGHDHSLWTGTREDVKAILTGTADAKGRAVFQRLPMPGPYDVVARAEGFTLGWQDNVAVDRAERRAVTLRLEPQRLCAVAGTVLAADGSPLPGATVGMQQLPKAATDASGRFRVEGLEPAWGSVRLVAAAEGYAPQSRDVRLCTDRDMEGIEFRLERAMPVGGRVVDQDGAPVAGVYLDLRRTCEQLRPDVDKTGPDGRFLFKDATAGPWKLRMVAPEGRPEFEVSRDLEVRGGDTGLEVVLKRLRLGTTRLFARVTEAATGKALDAAHAALYRGDTARTSEYADPSHVQRRSGEVIAERLPPGAWRLWVQVPGYAPFYADFTVSAAQVEARVEVRLGPAGRIVGKISGLKGMAAVYTMPAGTDSAPGGEFEPDGKIRGAARVADDGTFVIEKVAPGPTRVWLDADGAVGEVTADISSGCVTKIELVATPAARLAFRSHDPVPTAVRGTEVHVAQGDGDWKCVMWLGEGGRPLSHEHTILPGRTRWRVVFDSDGRVKTQEGVVDLVVGQTTEVHVPIQLDR
ncbi:MAG: collagen binding domain-containing protein, partial [Planctomycetota bacterium]